MTRAKIALAATAIAASGFSGAAVAQAKEQFVPVNSYWVGPYAAGGSGIAAAMIDYFKLLNNRDGGINSIKLTWEKCETEYNNARGVECYERSKNKGPTGATLIHPLSTGITYSLIEKGTQVVNLYHDSAYGKETIAILDVQAKRYGFEVTHIAVPHPGNEQQSQWLQIRQIRPDWVILRGWGVMNPTALKAAAKTGFPRTKMVGVWWSGAEEDVIPAGDAAKGYIAAGFNMPGTNFPVMQDVLKYVYGKGNGDLDDKSRIGSIYHTRGIVAGIITAEAIRDAQAKFGKGKPITGEQMRWALENLNIDDKRLKELGATGLMQPLRVSCLDHEGGGSVKFLQWDGSKWNAITDWITSDQSIVRPMIEESAAKYAKEKNIALRDCKAAG